MYSSLFACYYLMFELTLNVCFACYVLCVMFCVLRLTFYVLRFAFNVLFLRFACYKVRVMF